MFISTPVSIEKVSIEHLTCWSGLGSSFRYKNWNLQIAQVQYQNCIIYTYTGDAVVLLASICVHHQAV